MWEVITVNSRQILETNFLFALCMDVASEGTSYTHPYHKVACIFVNDIFNT
jgi:ribosomal protein S27E